MQVSDIKSLFYRFKIGAQRYRFENWDRVSVGTAIYFDEEGERWTVFRHERNRDDFREVLASEDAAARRFLQAVRLDYQASKDEGDSTVVLAAIDQLLARP